jgi:superfamily II DNA or RNA helicase
VFFFPCLSFLISFIILFFPSRLTFTSLDALGSLRAGLKDVLVTSYDTFRTDLKKLNRVDWACAIFDEVHKIKGTWSNSGYRFWANPIFRY